jgi:hypothetical protein
MQLLFEQVGDGRLARARQAGEPEHGRRWLLHCGARIAVDIDRLPMHVRGAAQRMRIMPAPTVRVGDAVDQDEGAGGAVVGKIVEGDRRLQVEMLPTPTSFISSDFAASCS